MSYDVGIHAWYAAPPHERPRLFAQVAARLPGTAANGRLMVADSDPAEIVVDVKVQADDAPTIERALSGFVGEQFAYQLERTFEVSAVSAEMAATCTESRPLTIHLCGRAYGVDGYYFKRNGLLRLSFSNAQAFRVPSSLLERVQALPSGSARQVEALRAIGVISHNVDVIHDVAAAIIVQTAPEHLMVCTEWEVHPLTAHAVYHRDVREFVRDVCRIVQLHEIGGLYLQDSNATRIYADPRKDSQDYGYLRDKSHSSDLAARVDELVSMLAGSCRGTDGSEDQIHRLLRSVPDTGIVELREGLYVFSDDGTCAYLEQTFLDLAALWSSGPPGRYVQ